jgi:NitT/TauT family transport system substrate-binding protein
MNKKFTIGLLILIIAFLCYFIYNSVNSGKIKNDKVVINYAQLRISTPILVAREQGYFKEVGLNVELKPSPTGQTVIDELVSGSTNIAGYSALPIVFNAMAKTKKELIFISALYENEKHPITRLIINNNQKNNISKIADLKGKRIGILNTKAYEVWLRMILTKNGIDLDKDGVVIQQIAPENQAEALKTGNVQALLTNDPVATKILSKGIGIELLPKTSLVPKYTGMPDFYFGTLCISKKYATENPEVVKKLSIAIDKAIDYIRNNPKVCYKALNSDPKINEKFGELINLYPPSYYKKTNEVKTENLTEIYKYYRKESVVLEDLENINNTQYKR